MNTYGDSRCECCIDKWHSLYLFRRMSCLRGLCDGICWGRRVGVACVQVRNELLVVVSSYVLEKSWFAEASLPFANRNTITIYVERETIKLKISLGYAYHPTFLVNADLAGPVAGRAAGWAAILSLCTLIW